MSDQGPQQDDSESQESPPTDELASDPLDEEGEQEPDFVDAQYEATRTVVERNGFIGNTIVVDGDFIGSVEGARRTAVPVTDVTAHVEEIEREFVTSPSFEPAVEAIEEHGIALLAGSGCGNRVTASVALRRTGHSPILELPGSLPASDLVDAVKGACKERAGVLVDSVDADTLNALVGFQLRHLRSALPERSAVVFTTRNQRSAFQGDPLPVVEGAPPAAGELLDSLGQRMELPPDALERARAAIKLLPSVVSPSTVSDLLALAKSEESAEGMAALVAGRSQALDSWLKERPEARGLTALAVAATAHGLPSSDFDRASAALLALLEGERKPAEGPVTFSPRDQDWPAGLATCKPGHVATYFGWQDTEVVEICPPHQYDSVIRYLWSHLGGDFRQPFLRWLRDLPDSFGGSLGFAAARTAGILFTLDPPTIERELLRPWALDDRASIRQNTAFALGMPVVSGADSGSVQRLLQQWTNSNSHRLRMAAVAAYGGPLGIWDPNAAAVSRLWEAGWSHPELAPLANRSFAALCSGGQGAERARSTAIGLLAARAESKDAERVYEILPLVFQQLTGGSRVARESLESLLGEGEAETRADLTRLLAQAFDSREGRESARASLRFLLSAAAAGRIGRDVIEQLVREMKAEAGERERLPALGSQLKQALKAEERGGGPVRDVARSIHETFYDQG